MSMTWTTLSSSLFYLGVILLMTSLALDGSTILTAARPTLFYLGLLLAAGGLVGGTRTDESPTGAWSSNSGPTESSKCDNPRDDGVFLSRISEQLSKETYALHEELDQPHLQRDYRKGWNDRARTIKQEIYAYWDGRKS